MAPDQVGNRALESIKILLRRGGVNVAEFQARLYEAEMVDVLVGFVRDAEMEPAFRRLCALDVIERARGRTLVAARIEMAEPSGADDKMLDQDVIDAKEAAVDMGEVQKWLAVPIEAWPAPIRLKYEKEALMLASLPPSPGETPVRS